MNPATECLLQILYESNKREAAGLWIHIHDEVNVAVVAGGASGDGAEDADVARPAAAGDLLKLRLTGVPRCRGYRRSVGRRRWSLPSDSDWS